MNRMQAARERLIVALDVPTANAALRMVDALEGEVHWFKVGMELLYAAGPDVVRELRRRGHRVFLDLKLFDIPNTVAGAVRAVAELDVDLLTVHAGGGPAMLRAAAAVSERPRLLGVTVLTSMDAGEMRAVGVSSAPAEQVERLAVLATQAGLEGLVCSPLEVERLRARLGSGMLLVTPGVRPEWAALDDQARVSTAGEALRRGANKLVIGRPITRAGDVKEASRRVLEEMAAVERVGPEPKDEAERGPSGVN